MPIFKPITLVLVEPQIAPVNFCQVVIIFSKHLKKRPCVKKEKFVPKCKVWQVGQLQSVLAWGQSQSHACRALLQVKEGYICWQMGGQKGLRRLQQYFKRWVLNKYYELLICSYFHPRCNPTEKANQTQMFATQIQSTEGKRDAITQGSVKVEM